ncbi:cupin domain-containing protein [Modestobacter sp. L9-4]|uniref:cupin domain-containing protein n=1 Tax=Modestobacter sp. L9-4 TaxID=2851567 RepID=UPI001C7458B0|nr:cupin domain-containing protein [Modestobacter sp. L9-4]QXG75755.1 cupin domain-containing protein [Modestobacter sp. L9-4]
MPDPDLQDRAPSSSEDGARPALRRCIRVDPQVFADEHWSRTPLLSTAAELGGTFTDLLDLDAVDELLSTRGLRTPFLRIAKDGAVVDPKRFTSPQGAGAEVADQVSSDAVLRLFAEGSTVVLQGLHRLWPPLIAFANQLAADLGHPTQVNAYVTPPSSRGFSPHYDVHDVFVLQVAGEKHWTIHEPVLTDPLRTHPWTDRPDEVAAAARRPPVIDTVLRPGDALYLPRGYIHSAVALGEISAHLTIGVHPVTRWGAVESALDLVRVLAAEDPALRSSLPLGVDLADPSATTEDVAAVLTGLQRWIADVDPAAVADSLRSRAWAQVRPAPVSPLAQSTAIAALDAGTVLQVRPLLRAQLREPVGERVALVAGRRTHDLPADTRPALAALLSAGELRVGDLPGLDAAGQLTLARRLVTQSIAIVPDARSGGTAHHGDSDDRTGA